MIWRSERRRPAALGALVCSALLVLSACGGGGDVNEKSSGSDEPTVDGPFSYTDARGKTVELDQVPTTVVAQSSVAAALWDAGYQAAGVYGELGEVDGKLNYQAGSIDTSKVEVLGKTYGEFNTQEYGLMGPDLLIDFSMDGKSLWYIPAEQSKQILDQAPSIGIGGQGIPDTDTAIETFVELAGKLGADTDSPELAADKEDYDAALDRVKQAAEGKQDIKVLLVSRSKDTFYTASPKNFPEIQTLAKAGVQFVEVDADQAAGGFFEELSWEQAGKYDADVILYDAREAPGTPDEVAKIPTWTRLPAVKAGQVYPWYTAAPYSYKQYAQIYDDIADWLEKAKKVS